MLLNPGVETLRAIPWVFAWTQTRLNLTAWLGMGETVHPVAFDGKVWCFAGQRPSIYAHAGIESLEVKFEPSANLLTLKFRPFLAGTGRPEAGYSFDDF